MISNRSVPTDTILPHIVYPDVAEAIAWLAKTFGFTEHYRYGEPGGPISGAQMLVGNACIMLKRAGPGCATPAQLGYGTQSLTVFLEDLDAHFQIARNAGARILEDLHETVYGERQYAAEDLAGHHWLFSRHARDVRPDQWGASVSGPAPMTPQISPMLAVAGGDAAIEFYKAAFDATVLWRLDGGGDVVAGLSVHDAQFFLADEAPACGTRGPAAAGFTTVRIKLFVNGPSRSKAALWPREPSSEALEHRHTMTGPRPIPKMLQGALVDPFGHRWLIGKVLEI